MTYQDITLWSTIVEIGTKNCGGGVGLFISNSVEYEILEFKDGFVEGVYESIWAKLTIAWQWKVKDSGINLSAKHSKGTILELHI